MATTIGLISDIHASPGPLENALAVLSARGVETILCAGDIAGYGSDLETTVDLLATNRVNSVLGNHDLWWLADHEQQRGGSVAAYLQRLPLVEEREVEGRKIVMVHGSPPASVMDGIKLLDEDGEIIDELRESWCNDLKGFTADVLVVGHTHQVFAERLAGTLVINPGSTFFNHSCAILTLPELNLEFIALGDREIEPVWNWGMQFRKQV